METPICPGVPDATDQTGNEYKLYIVKETRWCLVVHKEERKEIMQLPRVNFFIKQILKSFFEDIYTGL